MAGGDGGNGEEAVADTISYTVPYLQTGTTYYWKVVADDGNGGETESDWLIAFLGFRRSLSLMP